MLYYKGYVNQEKPVALSKKPLSIGDRYRQQFGNNVDFGKPTPVGKKKPSLTPKTVIAFAIVCTIINVGVLGLRKPIQIPEIQMNQIKTPDVKKSPYLLQAGETMELERDVSTGEFVPHIVAKN